MGQKTDNIKQTDSNRQHHNVEGKMLKKIRNCSNESDYDVSS